MTEAKEWTPEIGYQNIIDRGKKHILILSAVSSASSLLATVLLPFSAFFVPIIIICNVLIPLRHLLLLRQEHTNPARKRLSASRKLIVRWLTRLCFGSLVVWVYTPWIPWIVIITCPLGFYGYTYLQAKYLRWQLDREEQDIPLHIIEKIGLYGFLSTVAISFVVMSFVMYSAGVGVEDIINNFEATKDLILNWHWVIQLGLGLLCCIGVLFFFVMLLVEPISTIMTAIGILFFVVFLIGVF